MSTSDFKVRPLWPVDAADRAAQWRRADPETADAHWFDVPAFLQGVVLPELARQGRRIDIEVVGNDEPEQALVDVKAGKLFVREAVWHKAAKHDPRARLIIAHEIGHLVLHGDQVHAFTKPYDYGLSYLQDYESAEYQANWFAWSLLLPDRVLLRLRRKLSVTSIATLTLTEDRVVELRLQQLELDRRYRDNFVGDECPACGSSQVAQQGITSVCLKCGTNIASC
jgi:Zn-dependent peptidase ImmA (M78 family)